MMGHEANAWTRLGTNLEGSSHRGREILEHSELLGWNVRKESLITSSSGLVDPDHFAVVRDHPLLGVDEILGVVGKRYQVVPNDGMVNVLSEIESWDEYVPAAAGSMREGRIVFVTYRLDVALSVSGVEDVDVYLSVLMSHDGSLPATIMVTPVDHASGALLNPDMYSGVVTPVTKTRTMPVTEGDAEAFANRARENIRTYVDRFENWSKGLPACISSLEVFEILEDLFGTESKTAGWETRARERVDTIMREFPPGTVINPWEVFLAVCRYQDFLREVRPREALEHDQARAVGAIFDTKIKTKTFDAL